MELGRLGRSQVRLHAALLGDHDDAAGGHSRKVLGWTVRSTAADLTPGNGPVALAIAHHVGSAALRAIRKRIRNPHPGGLQ